MRHPVFSAAGLCNSPPLSAVKAHFQEAYSYGQLKMVLAWLENGNQKEEAGHTEKL